MNECSESRINTQQSNQHSSTSESILNNRIHTHQQANPHSTIESTLNNRIHTLQYNRIDNRQPNRKMASLPASYASRMLRQPLNNRFTRVFRLRIAGGTRRNNKGDSTRRYLPRTQARSWSLSTSGRGIAY